MHSPDKLLYLATQQLLEAIVDTENKAILPFIDQDLGQLEDPNPPVSWPCGLIDIDEARYDELGGAIQNGKVAVSIRLGFKSISSASNITPAPYRNKGLKHLDIEQLVYLKLHNKVPLQAIVATLNPDNTTTTETIDLSKIFGPYIRTIAYTENRNDKIRVRVIKFILTKFDTTAETETDYIPAPDIHITPEPFNLEHGEEYSEDYQ